VALSELEKLQRRIGKRIKELRINKNLKQQELAASCNLEKTHMSRIEAGGQNLTLKMLQRISKGLEVDISELFVLPQ